MWFSLRERTCRAYQERLGDEALAVLSIRISKSVSHPIKLNFSAGYRRYSPNGPDRSYMAIALPVGIGETT